MQEAVRFGRHNHLVGVLDGPGDCVAGGLPTVVIPNAGFTHHTGPFRLHVQLARALANIGICSLRFDLSGLGDSDLPRGRQAVVARKNADIDDALRLMQERFGSNRHLLMGLCSGASDSHRFAVLDERVVGVVMLDANAYPDKLYHILQYIRWLSNPALVARHLGRLLRKLSGPKEAESTPPPRIHNPLPVEQVANEMEQVTKKGVRYLFVFTAGRGYNHRGQLYSWLTKDTPRDRISVHYFPIFNHTFVIGEDREKVVETICAWTTEHFFTATATCIADKGIERDTL